MSEGEKKKDILGEIKEIFLFLTEGEPSPDDEIDARELMIGKFKELLEDGLVSEHKDQINKILKKLEEWDTLDLWFLETSIPGDIEQLLNISSKAPIKTQEISESSPSVEEKPKTENNDINIGEIVDKVSQQFKGEIDVLKDTIENLKKEIDKKDEAIKEASHKKKVQKITPKKNVRLPPPKIKIPIIKKTVLKTKEQIEDSIPPIPPEPPVKQKSQTQKVSAQKLQSLTPIPSKPIELEKKEANGNLLTPIPVIKPEGKSKKPEITTTVIEESKDKPIISEKIKVTTIVEEKEEKLSDDNNSKENEAFFVEKPKISSVRIEEKETESIKTSGLDLFDVLSSVGEDIRPKGEQKSKQVIEEQKKDNTLKTIVNEPITSKSSEKSQATSFIDFNSKIEPIKSQAQEKSSEELSSDKDTLYQELIALEGSRYAIEKRFKELENSYNKGSISDIQYKSSNEEVKEKMQEITTRINTIRKIISSL